ncbi:hypothetical protein D3C72_2378040 [compost metagenome]
MALAVALPGFAFLVPGFAFPLLLPALVRCPRLLRRCVLGLVKVTVIRRVVGNGIVIDAWVVTGRRFNRGTMT